MDTTKYLLHYEIKCQITKSIFFSGGYKLAMFNMNMELVRLIYTNEGPLIDREKHYEKYPYK